MKFALDTLPAPALLDKASQEEWRFEQEELAQAKSHRKLSGWVGGISAGIFGLAWESVSVENNLLNAGVIDYSQRADYANFMVNVIHFPQIATVLLVGSILAGVIALKSSYEISQSRASLQDIIAKPLSVRQ